MSTFGVVLVGSRPEYNHDSHLGQNKAVYPLRNLLIRHAPVRRMRHKGARIICKSPRISSTSLDDSRSVASLDCPVDHQVIEFSLAREGLEKGVAKVMHYHALAVVILALSRDENVVAIWWILVVLEFEAGIGLPSGLGVSNQLQWHDRRLKVSSYIPILTSTLLIALAVRLNWTGPSKCAAVIPLLSSSCTKMIARVSVRLDQESFPKVHFPTAFKNSLLRARIGFGIRNPDIDLDCFREDRLRWLRPCCHQFCIWVRGINEPIFDDTLGDRNDRHSK